MKELACIPTLKRRRDARPKPAILLNQLSHVWEHQSVDSEVSGYGWVEKRLQFSSGGRKFGVYVCQGS
ncbi:hypothetical protein V3C99_009179 [Haemonchus contortus]